MSNVIPQPHLSVEEYLAGEVEARVRHEYVAGHVYAMAGGTLCHNRIKNRIQFLLTRELENSPCEVWDSDTKLRAQSVAGVFFYYPDVMVVCDSEDADKTYQTKPVVIVEVLSKSTRRIDFEEKRKEYLRIETLQTYLLAEQSEATVTIFQRRADGAFSETIFQGIESVIGLPELASEISLAEIYRDIDFASSDRDEEVV